jgi:hypothetical protein
MSDERQEVPNIPNWMMVEHGGAKETGKRNEAGKSERRDTLISFIFKLRNDVVKEGGITVKCAEGSGLMSGESERDQLIPGGGMNPSVLTFGPQRADETGRVRLSKGAHGSDIIKQGSKDVRGNHPGSHWECNVSWHGEKHRWGHWREELALRNGSGGAGYEKRMQTEPSFKDSDGEGDLIIMDCMRFKPEFRGERLGVTR